MKGAQMCALFFRRKISYVGEVVLNKILKQQGKKLAGKLAKAAGRKILVMLAPYIPAILMFILAFILALLIIASIYSAMAPQNAMTGVENSPEDQKIIADYNELCDKYNVIDTWVVNKNPLGPDENGGCESIPKNPFYNSKTIGYGTQFTHLGNMEDRYRQDYKLRSKWSVMHSIAVYWAYTQGANDIPHDKREEITNSLHPYFFYKNSLVIITTTDKDGNTSTEKMPVYLLVEAYSLYGHYQYHYKWVTEVHEKSSITYEKLSSTQQILPNKWQRLEDYIKNSYGLKPDDDMELNRTSILEAAEGFEQHKEWVDWLNRNVGVQNYASSSMIPPELVSMFKEAESKYGIPWWFLAALAFKESSFNPQSENPKTHCYGLMQQSPANWEYYSKLLGYDPKLDKDNPQAQIMCGAYMLRQLGLENIDWGEDWKSKTLGVLTFYGGYRGQNAEERCRKQYAEPIWQLADQFRNDVSVWPVPGYTRISSYFGWRDLSDSSEKSFHNGIDIPAPPGTPVESVSSGVATAVSYDDRSGNYITIKDGVHLYSYCHLSESEVKPGDTVKVGQEIARVGYTGHVIPSGPAGAHLHFGVEDLMDNKWIDPLLILK